MTAATFVLGRWCVLPKRDEDDFGFVGVGQREFAQGVGEGDGAGDPGSHLRALVVVEADAEASNQFGQAGVDDRGVTWFFGLSGDRGLGIVAGWG
jgi:hypothetical protein